MIRRLLLVGVSALSIGGAGLISHPASANPGCEAMDVCGPAQDEGEFIKQQANNAMDGFTSLCPSLQDCIPYHDGGG
ncbi:MAG TPA: hypothetical protein VGO92_09490 [Acidimicrobiales bacterium]|jgi:hypothetical protein|nr:hypothetical protein [Acidimicrobiales bacterium]